MTPTPTRILKVKSAIKPSINWFHIFREKIPWDCVTFFILGVLVGTVF